jgi:ABC-type multidrug transport system fused ATPase/permease subunit
MEELEPEPPRIRLHDDLGVVSRVTQTWTEPVLKKAQHKVLDTKDLGSPPPWLATELSTKRFLHFWTIAKKTGRSWFWIVFQFGKRDLLLGALASFGCEVLLWIQAPLLDGIVKGLAKGDDPMKLYAFSGLLLVVFMVRLLCLTYTNGKVFDVGYVTRAAIMGSIYRKSLQFVNGPRQKYCGGRGINTLTNDTSRICSTISIANFLWITPVRFLTSFVFAYWYVGPYSLPAIVFILIVVAALYIVSRMLRTRRNRLALATDSRMGFIQESLQNIKIVKYLALEDM